MTAILRKLLTAARLLAAPGGLRKAADASRMNLRRLNILWHRGRPFHYISGDGCRFVCIPISATSVHQYLISCYEEIEMRICRQWLHPGDACLDIGANIGFLTSSFAACVGTNGLVVAVEPAPATCGFLRQGMQLLGYHNIRFEPVCVADRNGPVSFMIATSEGSDVEASMKIHPWKSGQFTELKIPA